MLPSEKRTKDKGRETDRIKKILWGGGDDLWSNEEKKNSRKLKSCLQRDTHWEAPQGHIKLKHAEIHPQKILLSVGGGGGKKCAR